MFKGFRMKPKLEFCFPELFVSWAKLNHQLTEHRMKENTSRSLFSSPASPWVPIQKISNYQWQRLSSPADVINLSVVSVRRQPWQPITPPPLPLVVLVKPAGSRGPAPHIFHLTVFFFWGGVARLTSFSLRFWLLLRGEMRECLFIKLFVSFYSFPSSCFSISVSLVTTLFLPASLPN